MLINEGFGANAPDPSPFPAPGGLPVRSGFALRTPYPRSIAEQSTVGQGEQLEPRIVLHPDRRRIGCGRNRRGRLRGGEQCDLGPGVRSRRAAVQDHVRHDQRRANHRPLHRAVRSAPTAARTCNGCCLSAAGSTGHGPTDHPGSARSAEFDGSAIPSGDASGPDSHRDDTDSAQPGSGHGRKPRPTTSLRPAGSCPARTSAGRPATGAARASARAGRADRLRHHRQRADHRSLHHDLRIEAQRRPIGLSR
jgi:hypothetical protein